MSGHRPPRRTDPTRPVARPSLVAALLLAAGAAAAPARAQEPDTAAVAVDSTLSRSPRVFLDCPRWLCDFDYFREQVPYVRWVRDRKVADVHVLVTEEDTGGGGQKVTMDLLGRRLFEGLDRRVRYAAGPTETDTETREQLVRRLEMGLMPYVAHSSAARGVEISYAPPPAPSEEAGPSPTDDPWNRWVFETDLGGSFRGEASRSSFSLNGSLAANRTTRSWKIDLGLDGRYSENRFELAGDTTVVSTRGRVGFQSTLVRSVGAHWSVGAHSALRRATTVNQDLAGRAGPAIEYNLFPYGESTRRQLTVLYTASVNRYDFEKRTVFGRLTATRPSHSLTVSLDLQQPWGEAGLSLRGRHFLDDVEQNRISLGGRTQVQLIEGLSLSVFGRGSRVEDQIYLPEEEATEEEVLTGERELATDFEFFFRVGLSYTFGSIYSGVVNPRFESFRTWFF